jgi:dihydrofolate synthase/folylpolyglutamate synthase
VVGVSFDKKASEIVGALAPSFDTIICTAAHHKGSDAAAIAAIAAIARKVNPQAKVHIAATIEEAFRTSRTLAASLGRKIYVAGGLFTAIEFAAVGRGMRATDLDFF